MRNAVLTMAARDAPSERAQTRADLDAQREARRRKEVNFYDIVSSGHIYMWVAPYHLEARGSTLGLWSPHLGSTFKFNYRPGYVGPIP